MVDFAALVDAPIMIGVRSTFSLWAGLMNTHGRVYFPQCPYFFEGEDDPIEGVTWIQDDEWTAFVSSTEVPGLTTEALMQQVLLRSAVCGMIISKQLLWYAGRPRCLNIKFVLPPVLTRTRPCVAVLLYDMMQLEATGPR